MGKKQLRPPKAKRLLEEPLLSVSLSDAVLTAAIAASLCMFNTAPPHLEGYSKTILAGLTIIGLASTLGIFRFAGFGGNIVRFLHETMSSLAGRAGVPFLGISFLAVLPPSSPLAELLAPYLFSILVSLVAGAILVTIYGSPLVSEVHLTVLGILSMGFIAYVCGVVTWSTSGIWGAVIFLGVGLIGAHKHKRVLGIRQVNLLHYGLAASMLLISTALRELLLKNKA